jgi:hypothetical protein
MQNNYNKENHEGAGICPFKVGGINVRISR